MPKLKTVGHPLSPLPSELPPELRGPDWVQANPHRIESYAAPLIAGEIALQPGDVPDTWADTEALAADVGYQPSTPVEVGVKRFVDWYLEFHKDDAGASG